jgi:mRNA interferase MazF
MPSTTSYKQGDVVLVPFPFTDLTATKQRPALVISTDAMNVRGRDAVLLAITSQIPAALQPDECLIPAADQRMCGLPKPSLIKLAKVITLHQSLYLKRLGALPPATLAKVLGQFHLQF